MADLREIIKWASLPLYGMYIKRDLEATKNETDLIEVCHKYLIEKAYTKNEAKALTINMVIVPIYKKLTGRDYIAPIEIK